jgi:hypothetical protein
MKRSEKILKEFNNIFNNKPIVQISNLSTTNDDFDISQAYMESLIVMEDEFFSINQVHLKGVYLGLKENNLEILNEAFGDVLSGIINFFKRMIDSFKEFMKKIGMIIYGYLGDFDKFIKNNKDKLDNLNPSFSTEGFDYVFPNSIPNLNRINDIINEYNDELDEIKDKTAADITKERLNFLKEENINKIRAEVLGKNGEITQDNYIKEIKKTFRSNDEREKKININKSYLNQIVDEYPKLHKLYGELNTEKDKVISLIEQIKSFFEKSYSVYYNEKTKTLSVNKIERKDYTINKTDKIESDFEQNRNKLDVLNKFYNFKFIQSKEIGGMCVSVITEKCNALKECLKFYRVIIKKCLFSSSSENIKDKK